MARDSYDVRKLRFERLATFGYTLGKEKTLGKKSKKNYMKMQMGDVKETFSNTDLLKELTGFRPNKLLSEGIKEFVKWYLTYFKH